MKIKEQIQAALELLKSQGCSAQELEHFSALAPTVASKSIGLLAQKYTKLLELARKNRAKDSDALAATQFSLNCKLDVSDLEICSLDITITFTESFKQKDGARFNVHEKEEEDEVETQEEPELPGLNESAPTEDPELPPDEDEVMVDDDEDTPTDPEDHPAIEPAPDVETPPPSDAPPAPSAEPEKVQT